MHGVVVLLVLLLLRHVVVLLLLLLRSGRFEVGDVGGEQLRFPFL